MNANLHEKRQVHILALGRCALGLLVPAPGLQVDTLQDRSLKLSGDTEPSRKNHTKKK